MQFDPAETVITGRWIAEDGKLVADENCRRIEQLTSSHLVHLADDTTGWNALYQNPSDNALWERTYPEAEMHGGGPPQLRRLSVAEAKIKYSHWSPSEISNG